MADNKREQILDYQITKLSNLAAVQTVIRVLPSYADLQEFGLPQFPVLAVVGQLPKSERKMSSRLKHITDIFMASLITDVYVYVMDNRAPDSAVASLVDDIWSILQADLSCGGLADDMSITMDQNVEYWAPFGAAHLAITTKYRHTTGGI